MITTKSKINFSNLSVPPIIPAVQGDTGRVIQFELNDFTIPAEATATYYVQKPSGEAVYNEATISGNNVLVELTAQSIIEVGENYGQVRILVDEEVVTSFDFILLVKTFRGIEAVQSDTEMNIFDKAVERAQETIASTVTEAEAAIEAAAQEAEEYIARAIDPTLTITNKAADAKVVGDLIAAQFDPTKQYEMDEPCLHDGKLYVSRSDMYSAPGEWVPGDWKQVIIGDKLQELTAATKNITKIIAAPWNGGGVVVIPYEVGDYCTRNGQLWRCTVANESGTWIAADWQNVTVADEITDLKEALTDINGVLPTKADKSGVVASAEQLLSDVGTEDKQPYLFRATPYDSTRVDEELVGVTVGWNQLVGSDTSSVTVTSGHKLYTVIGGTASIVASAGTAISVTGGTDMVVDLTAWFGSTIADYAYTLEQATAGSGVAFIKALLPGGYIPYSAPTLKSVSGLSAHLMRGFNQWDEEVESGFFNTSTGEPIDSSTRIRSKNYTPILPNALYYIYCGQNEETYAFFYDADKTYKGHALLRNIVFSRDAHFFKIGVVALTQYQNDICINISDPAKNGQYEPYKATTYALDSDLTLRGILKMDSDHNVYADGDVYKADGTVTRKFVEVTYDETNASEWKRRSSDAYPYFYAKVGDNGSIKQGSVLCDDYVTAEVLGSNQTLGINVINSGGYSGAFLYIRPTGFADMTAEQFQASIAANPLKVIYELGTPTTETADPFASPQNCAVGGTEEYIYAEGGSGIPVGHNSKYQKNLKGELERVSVAVPDAPSVAGTYSLKATVTAQGVTYGWVSD